MNNLLRTIFCISLIATIPLTPVHAANLKGRVTDGPFIGVVSGGDAEDSAFAWGWQGTFDVNPMFTVEASYARHSDELPRSDFLDLGFPSGSRVEMDVNAIALTGRVHLWRSEVHSFYLGAGAALYLINEDAKGTTRAISRSNGSSMVSDVFVDIKKDFGYHGVIGLEYSLAEHWEIFTEYRQVMFEGETDFEVARVDGGGVKNTRSFDRELNYDHGLFRLGLNYRF